MMTQPTRWRLLCAALAPESFLNDMPPLKIAVISAEVSPFTKVGGQADVAHALPKHLHQLGHEVIVVTPYYKFIDQQPISKELIGTDTVTLGTATYPVK